MRAAVSDVPDQPSRPQRRRGRKEKIHTIAAEQWQAFFALLRAGSYLEPALPTLGIVKTTWDNWRVRASRGEKPYVQRIEQAAQALALAHADAQLLWHKFRNGKQPEGADFRALESWLIRGPFKRHHQIVQPIELTIEDARQKGLAELVDVLSDFAEEEFADARERARFLERLAKKLDQAGGDSGSEDPERG